jgi:hormone-sensitive lipase
MQYFLNMPDYAHVHPFMIAPVTPSTGTHILLDFEKQLP